MVYRGKLKIESIIVLLFSILPVIDSFNGFLIKNRGFSIGTLYKVFLLLVLFLIVLYKNKMASFFLKVIIYLIGYVGFTIVVNSIFFSESIMNRDFSIKLIFNVLLMILLLECKNQKCISGDTIYRILNYNVYLIILTILVPYVLGVGSTIYAGNIGYKAFYYSQNELAVTLIILFYFCLYKLIYRINVLGIIQLGGIAVSMLLMNTKSALLACMLGVVVFVFEYFYRKWTRYKGIMFLSVMIVIILGYRFVLAQIQELMLRQNYLYKNYNNSLITTLTSDRISFLKSALADLIEGNGTPIRLIIGNGFYSNHLVEMDFIDIFFYLGLIGLFGLIFFLWYVLRKSYNNFKADHTIIRLFSFLLVISYAFFVGHVFFVATSGCYFVLLCCFNLLYQPSVRNKEKSINANEDICGNGDI